MTTIEAGSNFDEAPRLILPGTADTSAQPADFILPLHQIRIEQTEIATKKTLQPEADSVQAITEGTRDVLAIIRNNFDQDHTYGREFLQEKTLPFLQAAKQGFQPRTAAITQEQYASYREAANYAIVLFGRMQTIRFAHLDYAGIEKDETLKAPETKQEYIERIQEMQQTLTTLVQGLKNKRAITTDRSGQYKTYAFFEAAAVHNEETVSQISKEYTIDDVIEDVERELADKEPLSVYEEGYRYNEYLNHKRDAARDEVFRMLGINLEEWREAHTDEINRDYVSDPDDPKSAKTKRRSAIAEVKAIVVDDSFSFDLPPSPSERIEEIQRRQPEMQEQASDEVISLLGIEKPPVAPQPPDPMNYWDRKEIGDKRFKKLFGDFITTTQETLEIDEQQAIQQEAVVFERSWDEAGELMAKTLGINPEDLKKKE